jgi:hypothetical protein
MESPLTFRAIRKPERRKSRYSGAEVAAFQMPAELPRLRKKKARLEFNFSMEGSRSSSAKFKDPIDLLHLSWIHLLISGEAHLNTYFCNKIVVAESLGVRLMKIENQMVCRSDTSRNLCLKTCEAFSIGFLSTLQSEYRQ